MSRPNILVLHTDQQRFDTIAALGAGHIRTPNLNRLVDRGTTFTRAYSSSPVCMAARHDLLTGVSARHHGYWSNSPNPIRDYGLPTIPRLLTAAGYQTIGIGKLHHLPEREHHGFAHLELMEELPSCRENDAYLQHLDSAGYGHVRCQHGVRPLFYHTPQVMSIPEEHHGSAWVADRVIDRLRVERDRPFFIFASWVGPHPPYYQPRRTLDSYRDRQQPAPCPMPARGPRQCPPSPENATPQRLRRIREAYFGAITLIDDHIGRILDALEEADLADDTLIVFMTDHGEMLGDRQQYQKHTPYEGSAHIPMVACGPGFEPGICTTPVTTWDVAATMLNAAGVSMPADHPLLGRPLGECCEDEDRVVVFHHGTGRSRYVAAVGRGRKFIHWMNGGDEEFYDLDDDPWEQRDLGSGDAHPWRQACLEFERLHGESERVTDDGFVDLPYAPPDKHRCSLHPLWSSRQFPCWMNGYSPDDLTAIAAEMEACVDSDAAYICRDPEWRAHAVAAWQAIGGDPEIYRQLFRAVDERGA